MYTFQALFFGKHKFEFKWIHQNSKVIISNNKLSVIFNNSYFKATRLTDTSYKIQNKK